MTEARNDCHRQVSSDCSPEPQSYSTQRSGKLLLVTHRHTIFAFWFDSWDRLQTLPRSRITMRRSQVMFLVVFDTYVIQYKWIIGFGGASIRLDPKFWGRKKTRFFFGSEPSPGWRSLRLTRNKGGLSNSISPDRISFGIRGYRKNIPPPPSKIFPPVVF